MNCPKCRSAMQPASHEGIEIDRCTKCGGLWFDMLEAENLKKLGGADALDTGSAETGQEQNRLEKIECPRDSSAMLRMVVNGQPHIWYESCPVCYGAYFDAGEFKDFEAHTFMDRVKALFRKERK